MYASQRAHPAERLAKQRRGTGELEVPETNHAPPSAATDGSARPPPRPTDHFPFLCSKSQSSTLLSLYVGVHASWPTPLYSVYFGSPPAFLIAAIISRGRSTGTSGSASPWKIQIGSLASFSAWEGSPPAQMGIAAANSSGRRETRSQVP